ncbi:hypothetical protein UFOVP529_106 [uncultured Caudovirales phage]|uniref:Uncharacterized protein n=1 Tax=uncultured Caudovirales phage TaxID=2100421 RepID=A0A6J5R9T8_9CAUD|nr:hypothetical protein UFOVP529_106 [uncultured Caudovirales phage]CAB4190233.1 hypothetical protein UFOVP1191_44 [uncultured Caudovirales phage]CAB4194340.1 hypothetical protein UFOVP1252_15 [uncultured Caudovirales phage]
MIGFAAAQVRPIGQQEFTTPTITNTTFTIPDRVVLVSAVAVGAGGCGNNSASASGGGGGGLGYKNNIATTPGASVAVKIGGPLGGGAGAGVQGDLSYFIGSATVAGNGGLGGSIATGTALLSLGGTFVGDGGGNGGTTYAGNGDASGGGGAGGYSGTGGTGSYYNGVAATAGSGGGGGGGSGANASGGGGGGVGLLGQGSNGIAAGVGVSDGLGGGGGSGGATGGSGSLTTNGTIRPGGLYGGGGGSYDGAAGYGNGGNGAVRVIWGYVGNQPRVYTPLTSAVKYTFAGTADSWTTLTGPTYGAVLTTGASFLTVTPNTGVVNYYIERTGLSISGSTNRYFHITWKRTVAGYNSAADWDPVDGAGSQVFWYTSGHAASESYMTYLPQQYWDGTNFITTTVDMHNAFAGGSDWSSSTITGLRVDPDRSNVPYQIALIEVSPYAVPSSTNLTQNL